MNCMLMGCYLLEIKWVSVEYIEGTSFVKMREKCLTAAGFPLAHVDKSEEDVESESQLLECRLTLTEERNSVLVPSAGSGIPGAPAEWCVAVYLFIFYSLLVLQCYFLLNNHRTTFI